MPHIETTSAGDIITSLRKFCKTFETNNLAAKALKVTPAQLSTTLAGKANVIPEKILKKLGHKSALVYVSTGKKGKVKREPFAGVADAYFLGEPAPAIPTRTARRMVESAVVVRTNPETDFIDVTRKD